MNDDFPIDRCLVALRIPDFVDLLHRDYAGAGNPAN